MIKINLSNEQSILDFHYKNLTTKRKKELTVIDKIQEKIKKSNGSSKNMFECLLENVKRNQYGYSILTAKPKELEDFISCFEKDFESEIKCFDNELRKIFYYKQYNKWQAYELAKKIDVSVCPYCNRSYTFIIGTDLAKGTRFEFDHFYTQKKYPYLALSFYNLIPSCHICNSNLKGKDIFCLDKNIHPYVEGFGENIVFSITPEKLNFLFGKGSGYKIELKKGKNSKWENNKIEAANRNIKTFRLEDLYNMHTDYVDEIILKSIIYQPSYLLSLYNQFQGTLFKNQEDVNRFLLGNYTEEANYSKRVLSKLTADISKELGLL